MSKVIINKGTDMPKTESLTALQTPCFVLDEKELRGGITGFYEALNRRFSTSCIGYSVKTNSLPYAIAMAKDCGCYAEVVSDDELDLAIACGFELNHVIFNGPMKSKDYFLKAIQNGAIVNIETHREIEWLRCLPTDKVYNVGLRLSVNISEVSPEDADGENDYSRFGFSDATEEFNKAINAIKEIPQVRLAGLHIHRTSHSRSVRFYENSVSYAASVIKKYELELDYIDVGGGYYGVFRNAPTFDDYSAAIYAALKKYDLENLAVVVEPGNALVASAFSYYSTVIDEKELPNFRVLTTDGSRNDIDPFFRKSRYLQEIFRKSEGVEQVPLQIIAGATCLEYDKLFELENEAKICVGDKIKYNNVGAYTLTLTPNFINYYPRVYAVGEDGVKIVREKWTSKEYIQKNYLR